MIGQDIGSLERRCAQMFSTRTAIVYEGKRITYKQLHDRINRCAQALTKLGVKKGDRVCLILPNCPEYVELDFALAKLGAVKVALISRIHPNEWTFIAEDCEANTLVFEERALGIVLENLDRIQAIKNLVCVLRQNQELPANIIGYEKLLAEAPPEEPQVEVNPEDIYNLFYTGGTTGRPKGVIHTHHSFVSVAIGHMLEDNFTRGCVTLHAGGLPHGSGFMVLPTMLRGGTNVILDHFTPEAFFNAVEKERVTILFLAPTMIYMLLDHPDCKKYDLSSLQCIEYGGSPIATERLKEALDVFGNCLMGGFGLMEMPTVVCRLPQEEHIKEGPERLMRRLYSCGRPATMVQLRIVDDKDIDVPVGEVGEIVLRGPHVMKGYWKREEETRTALRNGWLHTGDLARIDEDGYVYIVDRKKDIIITGGLNVYPKEVEDVIYQHPAIAQAAVIGIPDKKWGEAITAFVVLRENAEASDDEIIKFCKTRLTDYKCPKSVRFIQTMPLTPVRKIDKNQLRRSYCTDNE